MTANQRSTTAPAAVLASPDSEARVARPTAAPDVLLELHGLRVERTGQPVLAVDHLAVHRGEIMMVVGPNGAGKSTLLRVMGLLEPASAGQIISQGTTIAPRDELAYRRRLAAVFQDPLLLNGSVADNVGMGLRLRGTPRREVSQRVARWLERLAIAHLARRSVRTLSGGEAQRVSLARALAVSPELLLFDEPFAALDTPTRASLTGEIRGLLAETETTTVWVTHERDEALTLGDRMVVLLDGRMGQVGHPTEVFGRPASAEVAAFLGVETVLRGRVTAVANGLVEVAPDGAATGYAVSATGEWPVGSIVYACLRPEDVTLLAHPDGSTDAATAIRQFPGLSARNVWPGTVRAVAPRGVLVRVEVDCGFPVVALVTRPASAELALTPGDRVVATAKATAIHLVPAA